MNYKPNSIESVVHEYHTLRSNRPIGEWMTGAEAKALILAIVARDMLADGGTVVDIEYETVESSSGEQTCRT